VFKCFNKLLTCARGYAVLLAKHNHLDISEPSHQKFGGNSTKLNYVTFVCRRLAHLSVVMLMFPELDSYSYVVKVNEIGA